MTIKNALDYATEKKNKSMDRLKVSEDLAEIRRDVALLKLAYENAVANDVSYSNDAKRKAAIASFVSDDKKINAANAKHAELEHESAVLTIDIAYCDDMIKALTTT